MWYIYSIFVSHLFGSGRSGVSFDMCVWLISKCMLTGLSYVETLISEKVSDEQSDPGSDSLAEKGSRCVFGPDPLPRGSILSASLTPSKVLCKDTHTCQHREVCCVILWVEECEVGSCETLTWCLRLVLSSASLSHLSCLNVLLNKKQK